MEIPRYWRLKDQMYSLTGDVCSKGHRNFPPDDVCKQCRPEESVATAIDANKQKMEIELALHQQRLEDRQKEA